MTAGVGHTSPAGNGRGGVADLLNSAAWVGNGTPPPPNAMFGPPFSPSVERGVDLVDSALMAFAAAGREGLLGPRLKQFGALSPSVAFGVGQAAGFGC